MLRRLALVAFILIALALAMTSSVSAWEVVVDNFASSSNGWTGGTVTSGAYYNTSGATSPAYICFSKTYDILANGKTAYFYAWLNTTSYSNGGFYQNVTITRTENGAETQLYTNKTVLGSGWYTLATTYNLSWVTSGYPFTINVYLMDDDAGHSCYLTMDDATLSMEDGASAYNITILNEQTLDSWASFTAPWSIEMNYYASGSLGTPSYAKSSSFWYICPAADQLAITPSNTGDYYTRKLFVDANGSDAVFYLSPLVTDPVSDAITVYDYTGFWGPSDNVTVTALKLAGGVYYPVAEDYLDVSGTVMLYLTDSYPYYIRFATEESSYLYGMLYGGSAATTLQISSLTYSSNLSMAFTRLSDDTLRASYYDSQNLTTWVNITIAFSNGTSIISDNQSVNTLVVTSAACPTNLSYNATFEYLRDGTVYDFFIIVGVESAPIADYSVSPPFAFTYAPFGIPLLPIAMFGSVAGIGLFFSAFYIRYGILSAAGLLFAYAMMGWLPGDTVKAFTGVMFLMSALFALSMRGRA